MCFSAGASFGAVIFLSITGVAAVKKTTHASQILFACIPFIFAIQQFSEGILWLSLPHTSQVGIQKFFTYLFLFFAEPGWPLCISISILVLEKKPERRNIAWLFVLLAMVDAAYSLFCLMHYAVHAEIDSHHILYVQNFPNQFRTISIILYVMATLIPPFFSHIKYMYILGITMAVSYIVSAILYEQYVLSVWCFFASMLSVAVYFILSKIPEVPFHLPNISKRSALVETTPDR